MLLNQTETENQADEHEKRRDHPGDPVQAGVCAAFCRKHGRAGTDSAHAFTLRRVNKYQTDHGEPENALEYQADYVRQAHKFPIGAIYILANYILFCPSGCLRVAEALSAAPG